MSSSLEESKYPTPFHFDSANSSFPLLREDGRTSPPLKRQKRRILFAIGRPRSLGLVFCSLISLILCLVLFSVLWSDRAAALRDRVKWLPSSLLDAASCSTSENNPSLLPPIRDGPLTSRFRDKLLPDHQYITSFLTAGWTNDVMSYAHLLQMAIMTKRTPILGPFAPSHIGHDAGLINFSDVFDINYLSAAINMPILEWHTIKNLTNLDPEAQDSPQFHDYWGGETEDLGCWSVWMTQRANGEPAREGLLPEAFNLDVSWMPVPFNRLIDIPSGDISWSIYALTELGYPQHRADAIRESTSSFLSTLSQAVKNKPDHFPLPDQIPIPNHSGKQINPDEQLLCFDYLYYVASYKLSEWFDESSPQWNSVGVHMRWAPQLKALAESFIRRAFGLPPSVALPPFISLHIRRADFSGWCFDVPREECFAPLSAYIRRVAEVKEDLVLQGRGHGVRVIVTSDEPYITPSDRPAGDSEAWWASVAREGWVWIDHDKEQTVEKHGKWYPSLIDACVQSLGNGFVGTDHSTMSLLAGRRVADWADGPTKMVKWGAKDADAH